MTKKLAKAASVPAPPTSAADATNQGLMTQASAALASPLSVLVVVPGLVIVVGLMLTLMADRALRASNLAMARDRLDDQAQTVADTVRVALVQADPMLERLRGVVEKHSPEQPYEALAHVMVDLMQGRPGVTYVSVSFPDGTFQGAYVDEDGALRFQDSRVTPQGTFVRRFDLVGRGDLRLQKEEWTQYDPRKRSFYTLAQRERRAVWTDPYPFFDSHATGVTRTQALYEGDRLHAVLTVDFDVHAMSRFLGMHRFPGMRAVLYADDGTVLAYAGQDAAPLPNLREERTLHFADLADQVMHAFFEGAKRVGSNAKPLSRIEVHGEPYLAVIADASSDPRLRWKVAYLAPESQFLQVLYVHQRESLWVAAVVLMASLLVAWSYARHVTRARREVQLAKQEAARARAEVRELGSYRLVECLGRGGMGEVWRAEHRLLAREAAVKLINVHARGDQHELKARFRREAEALAKLRSRHTIEIFDYGVADDGTFFFVMELLDGMDLETLVQRHGAQPWERVVNLLIQACSSLAEAHDAGLVHRDIKPANVFVCRAADELDIVKVLDFGLVRSVSKSDELDPRSLGERLSSSGALDAEQLLPSDLTLSGGVMGTPGFMPPEQLFGRELSGRSDLYALGAVGYFLLSGQLVFDHMEPSARIVATLTEELPDLRTRVAEDVPEALLTILTSCLARIPLQRPESARAVAEQLKALRPRTPHTWTDERLAAFWAERDSRVVPVTYLDPRQQPTRTLTQAKEALESAANSHPRVLEGEPR